MARWEFAQLVRRTFKSDDRWGALYLRDAADSKWERLSYTYELPWIQDARGQSVKSKSRITLGTYDLSVRADGPKGWRLQLGGTGHRTYIQIHRAAASMAIEGCILPVSFNDLSADRLAKGDARIQSESVRLMAKIKTRWDQLAKVKTGTPTLMIAATLPPLHFTPGSSRFA